MITLDRDSEEYHERKMEEIDLYGDEENEDWDEDEEDFDDEEDEDDEDDEEDEGY